SRTICAPIFSNLSSSSISLATVTPSLVMRGAPNDLSSTTLRPFGPSVTLTALARMSMPRSILSRASTENFTSFAAISFLLEQFVASPVPAFAERSLVESRTRLVILAWHPTLKHSHIHKTPHHPRLETDYKALDVAI